jgi:NAD+ synthase
MPFDVMDLLWYDLEHDVPPSKVAQVMNLTQDQVQRAFTDLERKERTTQYLRTPRIEYGQPG